MPKTCPTCGSTLGDDRLFETPAPPKSDDSGFAEFWKEYPAHRRARKPSAIRAYKAAIKSGVAPEVIMNGLDYWKRSKKWTDGYIPLVCTWLNGHEWDDLAGAVPALIHPGASRPDRSAEFARLGRERAEQ